LSDNVSLYSDILFSHDKVDYNTGSSFWFSSIDTGGYFVNANTGNFELWQRVIAPEEVGQSLNANNQTSNSYTVTAGARGNIGADWGWDAYYYRSEYKVDSKNRWPLASKIEQYFLGDQLGDYYGYPIYAPDTAKMYNPISGRSSFSDIIDTKSKAYTQNLNLQVTNTSLFSLPAGDVGVAALAQVGEQYWDNPTDPRVIAGDFWGLTGTQGNGKRRNYAGAVEVRVPIFSMLTANVSGRYDDYRYGGADHTKGTYKLGLEFRPFESLLIRGNYATAFRSPDMGYLFAGPSGYYTNGVDYYRCRTEEPGVSYTDCTYNNENFSGARSGNIKLNSVTAKSWGYGVVWSPPATSTLRRTITTSPSPTRSMTAASTASCRTKRTAALARTRPAIRMTSTRRYARTCSPWCTACRRTTRSARTACRQSIRSRSTSPAKWSTASSPAPTGAMTWGAGARWAWVPSTTYCSSTPTCSSPATRRRIC
jgi:outer membrane receptor protein involved in Fe transport